MNLAEIFYFYVKFKYTNNIHAQFFRYVLSYMKPDVISIVISSSTDIP